MSEQKEEYRNRSLYSITDDFIELESRLNELDDDEDQTAVLEWMQTLCNERQQKIDAYCWVIRKLEAEAEAAKNLKNEFAIKQKVRENRIEMLKSMMMQHMRALDERKLIGNLYTVAIQKNGGMRPVNILDEDAIPEKYMRVIRDPIKQEIAYALEQGREVPGAVLMERGESVRIK